MADNSKIEWTTHTFNPWWGCARVSPGCRNCYADTLATRYGHHVWRRKGPRRMLSDQVWSRPLKWNRDAERAGERARVFCASMADVFELHPVPEINAMLDSQRAKLWPLIESTPWLDWQLLTKRPENVAEMVPWMECWPANLWLGTSVEDQRRADERIPALLMVPATVRFLSCEPLIGPVDLTRVAWAEGGGTHLDVVNGSHGIPGVWHAVGQRISWCIVGGESGGGARPMDLSWADSLVEQCASAGVPVHVKQLGSVWAQQTRKASGAAVDPKGGDWSFWPESLRRREFPAARVGAQ